jgi:hypothetical protein
VNSTIAAGRVISIPARESITCASPIEAITSL